MSFTERLMDVGGFDLRLAGSAPWLDIREHGLIVVTPGPVAVSSVDALLSRSIFTGVVRTIDRDGRGISGEGLASLLGDSDNIGDGWPATGTPIGSVPDDLEGVIDGLLDKGNGITRGQVKTVLDIIAGSLAGDSPRSWLDAVRRDPHPRVDGAGPAELVGCEWRVNHDGTLDFDDSDQLWSTTPTVLIRRDRPQLGSLTVVAPDRLDITRVDTYRQFTDLAGFDEDDPTDSVNQHQDLDYWSPLSGERIVRRHIQGLSEYDGLALAVLFAFLIGRVAEPERRIELDLDGPPRAHGIEPGAHLWIHDPANGFADPNNPVLVGAETLHPVTLRANATDTPITQGMGVAHVTPDQTPQLVNLTPHVEWESGAASVEFGDFPTWRTLLGAPEAPSIL